MDSPHQIPPNPGSCGNCSLCCTLMRVASIDKPAFQACQHLCKKGGCSIYAERPQQCAEFECIWLASHRGGQAMAWARELRPDQCGVVLEINSAGTIIAHCKRPSSWMLSPIRERLLSMAEETCVLIEHGAGRCSKLEPDGKIAPVYFFGGVESESGNRLFCHGEGAEEMAAKLRAELDALEAMPDDEIDCSDIPETTEEDWAGAERGKFARPRMILQGPEGQEIHVRRGG